MKIQDVIEKLEDEYRYVYEQVVREKSVYLKGECSGLGYALHLLGIDKLTLRAIEEEVDTKIEMEELNPEGVEG